MKLQKLTIALLALAGTALVTPSVKAANFNSGDLMLGFYESGNSKDFVIDLGPAANFVTAADGTGTTFNLNITTNGLITELNNIDSSWATDSSLEWSAVGANTAGTILYLSAASFVTPGDSTPPTTLNGSTTTSVASTLNGTIGPDLNGSDSTASTNVHQGYTQSSVGTTGKNNFASGILGSTPNNGNGTAPDFKTGEITGGVLGTPDGSSQSFQLDLYSVPANAANVPGTYLGTFILNPTSGAITYTPEPSTYMLMGLGALLLFWQVRRRRNALNS